MALSTSERRALEELIAKGDLTAAHNLIAAKVGATPIETPAPPEPPAPPPPRTPIEVETDIFQAIYNLLGSSPALGPLLNEWKEVTAPKEPPASE